MSIFNRVILCYYISMAWDLSNYEQVEDRIDKFYKSHSNGRILTEIIDFKEDYVIFKANVYVDNTLVSTGYAHEKSNSSPVNKTSYVENCETSAIGRALANFNYAKKGARPSREEMQKVLNTTTPKAVVSITSTATLPITQTYNCVVCNKVVPEKTVSWSKSYYNKVLCFDCQKKETKL
jgi:hypothetical protein